MTPDKRRADSLMALLAEATPPGDIAAGVQNATAKGE
jgi:hypothetical protein